MNPCGEKNSMVAKFLEGAPLAAQIRERVKKDIANLSFSPKLVSLLIGSNEDAYYYAMSQQKNCQGVGIDFELRQFPDSIREKETLQIIEELNNDDSVTGILILMPVPPTIDSDKLMQQIAPEKDVEGLTPPNMGKLFFGDFSLAPCAAKAIIICLESYNIPWEKKRVVIVSRSRIVGQPLLIMLLQFADNSPTPTCCHIGTSQLIEHTLKADILVVAAGQVGLITKDMVKKEAVVVDVGINMVEVIENGKIENRIVGDVDFLSVKEVASWITPVPGGIGLITTALLLENISFLAQEKLKRDNNNTKKRA